MGEGDSIELKLPNLDFFRLEPGVLSNFNILSEKILDIITEQLGFIAPSVIMYDKSVQGLRVINYRIPGGIETVVRGTIGRKISDLVFPLTAKENLFVRAYLNRSIYLADSVREMAAPLLHPRAVQVIDKLLAAKMVAVVPIVVDNICIGVFGFGSRVRNDLTAVEKFFFQNLSQQIGHYLKHAWIVRMLIEKSNHQLTQNERLNKILTINRDSIKNLYAELATASDRLEISPESSTRIKEHLSYLQSLCLLLDQTDTKS